MSATSENLNQIDDILSTFQTQIAQQNNDDSFEESFSQQQSPISPIIPTGSQRKSISNRRSTNLYKETLKNNLYRSLNGEDSSNSLLNSSQLNVSIENQFPNDSNLMDIGDYPETKDTCKQSTPKINNFDYKKSLSVANFNEINAQESFLSQSLPGFKTARGNDIKITANSLKKAENLFKKVDNDMKTSNSPNEFVGFTTAKGNKIAISENALQKAQKLINNDDKESPNHDNEIPKFVGFSTASGKNININKEAQLKAQKLFDDIEKIDDIPSQPCIGFTTAKGSKINISQSALQKANKLLENEVKNDKETNESLLKEGFQGFEIKQINFKQEKLIHKEPIKEDPIESLNNRSFKVPNINNKPTNRRSLDSRQFKKPKVLNGSLAKTNFYIEKNTPTVDIVKREPMEVHEKPILIQSEEKIDRKLITTTNKIVESKHNHRTNFDIPKLNLSHFINLNANSTTKSHLIKPIFQLENPSSSLTEAYQQARINCLSHIKNRLENSHLKADCKSNGSLYKEKHSNKIKIQLKDLKFKQNNSNIFISTIKSFKFNSIDYYSNDYLNKNGCIECADGGLLVPNEHGLIGIDEFYNCLIDSNGVNAKLIDRNWFENHYKQILWKLKSYEEKFSDSFQSRIFTPENLIKQIKYRYDIEINNYKRSCLRKFIERDDTPLNRTVILFISNIDDSLQDKVFIELSDGWYSIRALCDQYLIKYIKDGKLKIGDKLAIFSAELVGPKSGFSPLDIPEDLFLKLSVNSCRKAKWFAKLGIIHVPLAVPLCTIKPSGNVGSIDIIIERVYPILYHEKLPDGSFMTRNEKQEEAYREKQMLNRNKQIESYMNSMDEESYNKNKNELEQILAKNMKNKDEFFERQVTPILKIRIAGTHMSDINKKFNSTLTIWHNAVDINESLREASSFRILNLSATIPKTKYESESSIVLNTTTQTRFIPIKTKNMDDSIYQTRKYTDFISLYKNYIESSYNEIDTCGIVVYNSTNNYNDLVYLYNGQIGNSVVCICFPKDTNMFGFKDILKLNEVVACLNIKFTLKKDNNKYPSLLASNQSIFTQRLAKYKHLQIVFDQLKTLLKLNEQKEAISNLIKDLSSNIEFNSPSVDTYYNKKNFQTPFSGRVLPTNSNEPSPILMTTKNTVRKPGLSAPKAGTPITTKIKNYEKNNIYLTKTVKRLSEDAQISNTSHIEYDNDTSFSTQELKDISLLNDSIAKRPKY